MESKGLEGMGQKWGDHKVGKSRECGVLKVKGPKVTAWTEGL